MAAHAKLSPSSAERWMTCPGSVLLSEGQPNIGSEYADEGTAAHFLAQHCLETGDHPVSYLGKSILVWDHPESDSSGCDFTETMQGSWLELTCREFEIDADFAASVNSYVQCVRSIVEATSGTLLVEQTLDISHLTGEVDAEGTSDAVILAGDELIVVDLKFGRGVEVDAKENKQLQIYALAAFRKFEMLGDFNRVRLVIHQPRLGHVSEWDCGIKELWEFAKEVSVVSATIQGLSILPEEESEKYLEPSEKACQWCKVKNRKEGCPALDRYVQDAIAADFEVLGDISDAISELPDNDAISLSAKMQACDLIEQWVGAVRGRVEYDLLHGVQVPGYKLVQGKKGNRQWDDAATAEQTLKGMKIKVEDMYDMKVISPTTAEKLFKAGTIGPRQWPKVEALIVQKDGKPSVAPESDKRPALEIGKPEDDFENLEEQPSLI